MLKVTIEQNIGNHKFSSTGKDVDTSFLFLHTVNAMEKSLDFPEFIIPEINNFVNDIKSNLLKDSFNTKEIQDREVETEGRTSADELRKGDHVISGALLASVEARSEFSLAKRTKEISIGYHKDYGLNLELGDGDAIAYPIIKPLWENIFKDAIYQDILFAVAQEFKHEFDIDGFSRLGMK